MERKGPEAGRPAVVPDGAAPAPVAPRAGASAAILRLQRTAGNRAVLAALAGGAAASAPVIRRAWSAGGVWDALINGVRWTKVQDPEDGTCYQFEVVDGAAIVRPLPALVEAREGKAYTADDWRACRGADVIWDDALVGGAPPAAAAPAAPVDDAPAEQAALDAEPAAAAAAPAAAAAVPQQAPAPAADHDEPLNAPALPVAAAALPAATPHPHPGVASTAAPLYGPEGKYAWKVRMTTGAALAATSWVIQKVDVTDHAGHVVFYEAFEVAGGQTTMADDVFQDAPRLASGSVRIVATMQHISYAGGAALPPGMVKRGADESDGEQPSSYAKPHGWQDGAGTPHEMHFVWDDASNPAASRFDTVPNGGAPVFKADGNVGDG